MEKEKEDEALELMKLRSSFEDNFVKPVNPVNSVSHVVEVLTLKSIVDQLISNKENEPPGTSTNNYSKWPSYLTYCMVNKKFFDCNLLMLPKLKRNGCPCTKSKQMEFTNPFFGNALKQIMHGKNDFLRCGYIHQNEACKQHFIDFSFNKLFHSIITQSRPTIYVSECVKGTEDTIGCTYTLMVKLIKNNQILQIHTIQRHFQCSGNDKLCLHIDNYPEFDQLLFCHKLTASTLSYKKVYSIKIGRSCMKVLSNSIEPPIGIDSP